MTLLEACRDTLRTDDRGSYTVPSPRLYPYQWLWDAGFIALGWATFDKARAWVELETLLTAQWPDGMVPHIVFHRADPGYFPGPDAWGATGPVPSSGITQPPVLATVVRRLLEGAGDSALAEAKARNLYPKLLAFHRWFYHARDPEETGLVAILHPWESGMDNSPLWDRALQRVPRVALPAERRDTSHVSSEQRPKTEEYERYMGLVKLFREHDYDPVTLYQVSPFKVASVAFNAILHRSNRDLLALAQRLGFETNELERWLERGKTALQDLWNPDGAFFYSRDLVGGESIKLRTFEGFMPLYAGVVTDEQARKLTAVLEAWTNQVSYLLPSFDPADPVFEPKRYWRGPVWINVNWLVYQGLLDYGFDTQAERLKEDSFALVDRSGLFEYFNPATGEGLGGHTFAWTAALLLDWLAAKEH